MRVAGVDEVGRGSLFGPVVAAAVILNPDHRFRGLRESKLLPAERREVLKSAALDARLKDRKPPGQHARSRLMVDDNLSFERRGDQGRQERQGGILVALDRDAP